jgi:alpha/beta superfamily hydrolase
MGVSVYAQSGKTFKSEKVQFTNAGKSISFSGTLSTPFHAAKGSLIAVVIVSGTGPQDEDGTMAGHKIFKQIADSLTQHGIAVLRTNDRGVGKTTGNYATSTTADFADDALAAVAYLKTRKEINQQKIGLLGHSEGGAVIAIAASKSADVHFLVSIAGLAMSGYDALVKQNEDIVASATLPDYDRKRYNEINGLMFKTALAYADSANMEEKLNETYEKWRVKDSAYFKTLNVEFDHFRFPIYSYVRSATGPWYRYFVKYNAEEVMSKIKVPVLALNGDKDVMVAYKENLENWRTYPAKGGNDKVTTMVIPGVNHLFLPCKTCDQGEYANIKEGFSDVALAKILDWLKQR